MENTRLRQELANVAASVEIVKAQQSLPLHTFHESSADLKVETQFPATTEGHTYCDKKKSF